MIIFHQTYLIGIGAFVAGFLGALTGLGGGVVLVPLLTLVFDVQIRYAIGASLVSVIATSSGAASAYVKEGFTNLRVGMLLEIGTVTGALIGASIAPWVSPELIAIIFGLVLIHSAIVSRHPRQPKDIPQHPDKLAAALNLDSTYPTPQGPEHYYIQSVPGGFGLMAVAGILSSLLGIGSGALKVIAMDQVMKIPFKVSTTTSNFMIGVTAAASAGIYLSRGYIDPGLAFPVMLGVLSGSLLGAMVLTKVRSEILRIVFSVVILGLGIEMIINGLTGRFG